MFNNFSILSELIVENRTLAERFLENLSSVYRYVIQNLKRDTVPVSEELDFLRSYLYLIGMRYENAISVDVDEQLERTDGRIPPVCLQLLVENAIKHNRLSVHQPLHIHVFREGNHIVVKNDLCPVSSDLSSTGIGQRNIIERYFLLCEEKPVIKKSEHSYIVNIKKVSGPGWGSPDEAVNNRSAHIVAEIQAWDDYTIDMNFDGEHHFGVSTREIVLKNKAGSAGIINVSTDLPDYTLQWADAAGTPTGTGSQSLANEYFTVTKAQNGSQLVITALQSNSTNDTSRIQNFVITAHRWRILVNIQQKYDVAAYQTIHLLTFNAGLGYLGTNIIGSGSAEARATGLRGILNNQNNFGPTGTVECGGYNLIGVNANYNNLTDALFASFDVVYVHYMGNLLFGTSDAQKAHNWVKSKKNRVLIVSYDALDVSQNLLKEILGGNNGISFLTSNTGPYPLATPENGNSYFSTTGPFTSAPYTPINTDFSLRNYDAYHGEIQLNTEASKGITPILMGPAGGIVLGIDYSRRIVYWGDTDIGSSASSSTSTTDNRINNNSGTINNNASKLIANVFAWIAETVLYGE